MKFFAALIVGLLVTGISSAENQDQTVHHDWTVEKIRDQALIAYTDNDRARLSKSCLPGPNGNGCKIVITPVTCQGNAIVPVLVNLGKSSFHEEARCEGISLTFINPERLFGALSASSEGEIGFSIPGRESRFVNEIFSLHGAGDASATGESFLFQMWLMKNPPPSVRPKDK